MSTDTIFIRHKLMTTADIVETLWREDVIAVHYVNDESTDPEHYRSIGERTAATVLARLHACIETGAIVAASYRELKPGMLKVGRIDPGGSRLEARRFRDARRGELIYKTVNLVKVRNISLSQYPVLMGIQPRGGTLTGWKSAATILQSILRNDPLPIAPASLHYSQLEVLCQEYLRQTGQLKGLLAPIGRGMYEVDICGMTHEGKLLFAQVTHHDDKASTVEKAERLAALAGGDRRLIYFAPASAELKDHRMAFIPIEDVFATMLKEDKRLIERMLSPAQGSAR